MKPKEVPPPAPKPDRPVLLVDKDGKPLLIAERPVVGFRRP